jgi:DNA topoisomerase VI subunit B
MPPTFERTIATLSRVAEYFSVRELQAMTGQYEEDFAAVVIKELLDNAIDGCEDAKAIEAYTRSGNTPMVHVRWHAWPDEDRADLTVADNGVGIPPAIVASILNFDTRTSDKVIYRSPTRGAQGNAMKTVLGIPYALGIRAPLVIEAHGVRHTITGSVDPAGNVHIRHDTTAIAKRPGTSVMLTLPAAQADPACWGRAFAVFNPHTSVKICQDAHAELAKACRASLRTRVVGIFTNRRSPSQAPGANTCRTTSRLPGGIAPTI